MSRPKRPSERTPCAFALVALAGLISSAWPAGAALAQADAEPNPGESLPNLSEILENEAPIEPAAGNVADVDPLRRARDALLAAGDHSAALPPAEDLVARPNAASDPQYAADLIRLGLIHTLLGEFEAAEQRYFEAIDVIQREEGDFGLGLVEPYRALGRSYIRERRFVEAVTALGQAQHVSQRNLGLHNVDQAGLIDDLTTAHLGLGDVRTAGRLQLERLDNAVRQFGPNDPRIVPYRYGLAEYYEQSRLRGAAREQYEKALEALEPLGDEGALLEPLRRLLRIEIMLRDRDDARQRIADILREPDIDDVERARAVTALGDFAYARNEDLEAARARYAEAYALLEGSPAERERLFAAPEMLDFVAPLSRVDVGQSARPYAWGTIVLGFDVAGDGRARDVTVISSEPAGVIDAAYVRRIREAHFRPRIVDGTPVPSEGVRYTHYFRYYVARD